MLFSNMDEIDRKILQILQEDDKVPYHKMGEGLGIGASTVHSRVRKMVNEGFLLNRKHMLKATAIKIWW